MKLPKFIARKKLRATAVRRPLRASAQADYDEMSEPNMKLSRALLIVLLLHVVAVSGIIAFNAIKTRQGPIVPLPASTTDAAAPPKAFGVGSTIKSAPVSSQPSLAQKQSLPARPIAKEGSKTKQSENAKSADSGNVYIVVKGDNPVTIAKKFKVPYDDLVALNHIDDPRKLKIGQKLLIPNKSTKAKKTDE
jgi:LysM repeat protein